MPIWRNTTGDGLWGTAGNWIADGSGNSGVPTSATDAIFDSLSPSCTVNTNARPCANFTTTGFTNTITFNFDVQVNGNVTLGAGMLFGGTGFINMRFASAGLTRNFNCPTALTIPRLSYNGGNSGTITFTNNTTITNLTCTETSNVTYTFSPVTGSVTITISDGTFNTTSILNVAARAILNANTTLTFSGTCTLTANANGAIFLGSGTIQTASGANLTINRNWTYTGGSGGTINFSQGTVTFGTTTFRQSLNSTLNFPTSVGAFNNFEAGGTLTLQSDVAVAGTYSIPGFGGEVHTINGAFNFIVRGSVDMRSSQTIAGNATFKLETNTNATLSGSSGVISISNFIIDKGTGILTISHTNLTISSANYTVTSGIISHTSTINLSGNQTITHTVLVTYNNITIAGNLATKTLNSNILNIAGTLTCNTNQTFSGTAGWTAANFTNTTAGTTITLQSGVNYTVTSNLRLLGTNASPILLSSSSPTTRAFLTLNYGASMLSGDGLVSHAVYFVRATRIDSSLGQTIWNTFGSISTPLVDTVNWNPGSRPNPTSYTYIT
jgi:hypothetical protein